MSHVGNRHGFGVNYLGLDLTKRSCESFHNIVLLKYVEELWILDHIGNIVVL